MAKPVVFSKTQTGTYLIKGQILSDTAGDKNELNDFTLVFMEAAFQGGQVTFAVFDNECTFIKGEKYEFQTLAQHTYMVELTKNVKID